MWDIDQIKQANKVEDVIQDTLRLKRVGNNYQGMCFGGHDSKSPSLTVFPETQTWYCFGCRRGGDVINFIKDLKDYDFEQALDFLTQRAGIIKAELISSEDSARFKEEREIQKILFDAVVFYQESMTRDVWDYLTEKRNLNSNVIDDFWIGFAKGGLKERLIDQHKYPLDVCLKAGVLKKNADGKISDYFYRHVIFPNFYSGNVVHISGRILGNGEPKYLHLKRPIKNLYNESALKNDAVYLVEGQVDALTLIQHGFNACGVLGVNNFKKEWVERFSKCKTVHIIFDGDEAGKAGALRAARLLGVKARIVNMPKGVDINEFFRK